MNMKLTGRQGDGVRRCDDDERDDGLRDALGRRDGVPRDAHDEERVHGEGLRNIFYIYSMKYIVYIAYDEERVHGEGLA
jgi:hypothetical protein